MEGLGSYVGLSRSSSRRSAGVSSAPVALASLIGRVFVESLATYAVHRACMPSCARSHGIRVGRQRVARLMRQLELEGVSRRGKRRRTTIPDPGAAPAPDLVGRRFTAARPNELWLADITYLPTREGWVFLAVVLDGRPGRAATRLASPSSATSRPSTTRAGATPRSATTARIEYENMTQPVNGNGAASTSMRLRSADAGRGLGWAAAERERAEGVAVPERDGYIAGVPCWVDTSQPDPDAAAEFYGGLFGWEFEDAMPAGSEGRYLIARLRGGDVAAVSSLAAGAPSQASWNTYIWVEDADEAAARAREAGGSVLSEPFEVMDAGRMAVLADPEGAAFSVWQARAHRGARIVNEPGSLNFNVLNTRDPEVAKRFYGALFGWTTLYLGSGEFWTLSAYGDYLEELTPGVRERTAEMGAAGFEDVVAAITPIAGDDADTPAQWSVTFSTDDADATAAKAADLGGTVLVAPVDAPYSRLTVLRDPREATFSATAFVPENKDIGREGT